MPRKASGNFNQLEYINEYIKEKYDRVNLTMPAGKKAIVKEKATLKNMSVNQYINYLIDKDLERK